MSDLVSSGALNLVSLALSFLLLLVGLVLWFFVNRASSRTNEQIELLESLLDQQKRQNALLRRLCEASEPEKKEEEAQKPSIVAAAGPVVIGQGGKVTTTEPAQATVPAATLTPATPVGKASADMPGYVEIDLKQIPGEVYALMGSGKLVISIGKDEFNMTNMTANAGGALGYQSGKAVAYCTLSPDQSYEAMEKADSYALKLYAPNQTTPSAVIECKKLASQTTPQAGQPRTYVGEIVKLLMKK